MQHLVTRLRASLLAATLAIGLAATGSAQFSITTTYAGGNSFNGNMFDVKALISVIITGFDVNFVGTANFEVWAITGGGTYLGQQMNAAAWTMLGSANNVTSLGSGLPTPLPITTSLVVPAGQIQGIYVTLTAGTMNYTNGVAQGVLYTSNSDIEIYEGHGGQYPFALINVPRVWNGTLYYSHAATVADDIGVTGLSAPVGQNLACTTLTSAETVTMEMRNWGMNPVPAGTTLLVSYQIDNNPPTIEALLLANPLTIGQSLSYTFLATGDFSQPGPHAVTASVTYAADLDPSNDNLVVAVDSGPPLVTSFPFVESFDGLAAPGEVPPVGWAQDPNDASGNHSDWKFTNAPTPTGPPTDLSGSGYYAYVDDDGNFPSVNLRAACLDLSSLIAPRLSFYLWSNNTNSNPLNNQSLFSLDVISVTTGTTTTDAVGPVGHIGASWNYQFLDLAPWSGQTIQLVFRVNSSNGGAFHDIAIDEVAVYDPLPTPGQAPQAGLAVLDVADCRNGNLEPTFIGSNGPYYAGVPVGGVMDLGFGGEPGMPIVLLAGPLNPVAATFANVGQFDIGGPVDPMTGIPTSLLILADGGNGMGLNAFFVLGPTGRTELGFGVPALPTGVLGTFQAAIFTSGANGAPVALSNAVEVTLF